MEEDYSNDPVLSKYKYPGLKAAESEQKRLAALNEKVEQEKKTKNLIKSALSGQVLNKKIIFDSSVVPKKEEPIIRQLFTEDDNNEFGEDESFDINVSSKRFNNPKGSKLIELQSRFAHDPRFKIDDRFIDDEEAGVSYTQDEAKKEEDKQMDILEEVLGKPLKRKFNVPEEKQRASIIIPRYDPSKVESQKFKIRKVTKLEPYQLPQDGAEEETSKPEVSKERFYEISETFTKDFNDDQFDGQSFSLTALFGRPATDTTSEQKLPKKPIIPTGSTSDKRSEIQREKQSITIKQEKPDTSEDEEDEEEESTEEEEESSGRFGKALASKDVKIKKENDFVDSIKSESQDKSQKKMKIRENSKVSNPLLKYEKFFFCEGDERLKKNSFYSVERIKAHIASWKQKKLVMATALTKKRRHFKHVSKLKSALEIGNPKDKTLKKKYRIYKETTKKH